VPAHQARDEGFTFAKYKLKFSIYHSERSEESGDHTLIPKE
jgi:hypothetical protein